MATNNFNIKDASGSSVAIKSVDTGAGHVVHKSIHDGTNQVLSGSATNISAKSSANALLTTHAGDWSVTHAPAANTQATITKAAGASGVRHVCTSVSATFAAGASAPTAAVGTLNLIDGATGGTPIASWIIGVEATAGRTTPFVITGLNIVGTAATAMTLEFAAAGGANTYQSVAMTGHECS